MRTYHIVDDAARAEVRERILAHGDADAESQDIREKVATTKGIVGAVRREGDAALARFTEQFDGCALTPAQFEVTQDEVDAACAGVDASLLAILERAHANIQRFHAQHLQESWEERFEDGTVLGQRVTPIERVGVYVPGGTAFYPSSVLMNIIPARVAGVTEIIMVSPPSYNGCIHPVVLAAAKLAGATRIFRVGGAQAIAALAYGTETIPAVAKITGPGNTFVAAAKGLVSNVVAIDSEAGPSEVVVIADDDANPAYVAAELLSQAEHDTDAMAVLICASKEFAEAVARRVEEEAAKLPRRDIILESLNERGMCIIVRSMDEAIELTNLYAPEHLNIQTADARAIGGRIVNAGAIMLGPMTPVAVGDYYAGPNHILPTGRRARFASPLTAGDFRKITSILEYSEARLARDGADIEAFAAAEGLDAHARSIAVRTKKDS